MSKRASFENSRQELSLNVSVGVHTFLVVEQSSVKSQSRECAKTPILPVLSYMCFLCDFFPFILDIKFVGRTSRGHTGGRPHRISHPPSFCVRALMFLARRIQPFSFPSSTVKSNFVYY